MPAYCAHCERPLVAPEFHKHLTQSHTCAECGKVWWPGADSYHVIYCFACNVFVCYDDVADVTCADKHFSCIE